VDSSGAAEIDRAVLSGGGTSGARWFVRGLRFAVGGNATRDCWRILSGSLAAARGESRMGPFTTRSTICGVGELPAPADCASSFGRESKLEDLRCMRRLAGISALNGWARSATPLRRSRNAVDKTKNGKAAIAVRIIHLRAGRGRRTIRVGLRQPGPLRRRWVAMIRNWNAKVAGAGGARPRNRVVALRSDIREFSTSCRDSGGVSGEPGTDDCGSGDAGIFAGVRRVTSKEMEDCGVHHHARFVVE